MKMVGRLALCFSALFILIFLCACKKVEYSINDFADVKVVGYAEHGSLSVEVKKTTIDAIGADEKNNKSDVLRFAETFKFTYDGQDDDNPSLSNGDVVKINVAYDEELAQKLNIIINGDSFDFTVQGLEDKTEMSPFEGLSVKFSGVAPYGTVQLDKSNCIQYIIDNVTFFCDDYDLSNGDKVVVKAEFNAEMAERSGYIFTENVKKYTVVGISKYVKTMAGVSYEGTTAIMRRMVERYVSAENESYKFLDWDFGGDDTDTDNLSDADSSLEEDGSLESDDDISSDLSSDGNDENSDADKKPKRLSNSELIQSDFTKALFDVSFDYEPLACHYSLNPVQYSDNLFSATYKVTGTFVCKETNGTSYINVGDTVIGELYVITSLGGGSVDIKNKLVYEDTKINNYNAYSLRSFGTYEELSGEIFGNVTYLTENLDYVEDQEVYDEFVKKENDDSSSRYEVSHITIDSSTDTESSNSRRQTMENGSILSEPEVSSESDTENNSSDVLDYSDSYEDEDYFNDDDGYLYY